MMALAAERSYGSATLGPGEAVTAGEFGTWRLVYTVGRHGVDDLGTILIARRLASDWGRPQFEQPTAANYTTVTTNGAAKLRAWFDPVAYIRPWKAAVVIRVYDGALAPGDEVVVTFGDRSGGGPGAQAQRFRERSFEFRVAVDCFGTGQFVVVPDSPTLEIVGGPPVRLRVMAPSLVEAGQPFALTVKLEDRWGNPAERAEGQLSLAAADRAAQLPAARPLTAADGGAVRFDGLRLQQSGVQRLTVRYNDGALEAVSNPLEVVAAAPGERLFWGDPHGQTEMAVGTGSVEEYFGYGRDIAGLDFIAHCANDFQIDRDDYEETRRLVRQFHQPGRYVTFHAYEWSGNTPCGGDHNVYFLGDDETIHRSSHWQIDDRSDEASDRYPISALHDELRGREDVLILPHIGGRRANLDFHDATLGPVIEIQSVHGLFWWFAEEALQRGRRVGFIAGSDDHTGRPGSTLPTSADIHFGMRGGLTAVYASELTRAALGTALKARRCYGTTGERIVLAVTADGRPMGAEYQTNRPPRLGVRVLGTAPLERVELYRGLECIQRPRLAPVEPGRRLQIVWSGARVKGRNRETHWDGELRLEGGQIVGVTEFAFDGPEEGVVSWDAQRVSWRSSTCGDPDGLWLDLEQGQAATLTFTTPPAQFTLPLAELGDREVTIEAGGVDQRVTLAWAPTTPGPLDLSFEYTDAAIQPGINAYYLRVRQTDGAMAWSSPIYVGYTTTGG